MPVPLHTSSDSSSTTENKASIAQPTLTPQNSNVAQSNTASQQQSGGGRVKSEAELEAERMYEERMEEEYAKREGGA
jgi:hypothetical protein